MKLKFDKQQLLIVSSLFMLLIASFGLKAQKTRELTQEEEDNKKASQKRVALVIGNGAYTRAKPLPNPSNDAADMAKTLRELGFEVISGVNQNKRQMETLIREFGTKLTNSGGVGLFYYAGHGLQVGGENFLVPVDADIPEEDEVAYSAVSINLVLSKMQTAKNDLNIIILDACRNNPFARSWRSFRDNSNSDGLAKLSPPTGTLVLYATEPGKVASDGAGRNGLFTEALLRQIKQPNLEYDQMVKAVSADVWAKSNRQQLPWKEGNTLQDFYFAGANASVVKSPAETVTTVETKPEIKKQPEPAVTKSRAEIWAGLRQTAASYLKYDAIGFFSEELAVVRIGSPLNGKYGFIDKTGKEVIPLKYDYVTEFSEGLAAVRIGDWEKGKYGYIDKAGREVIPLKYEFAGVFSEGLAAVMVGEKAGYIDKTGREVIPLKFERADEFSEGLAAVSSGGKYGYIDNTGREVIPFKFDNAFKFMEGLAAVRIGDALKGKAGFIDKAGREVIPFKYDSAIWFTEGLAGVRTGGWDTGKSGFIDKNGKEVIPYKYDYALEFFDFGLGMVMNGSFPDKTKYGFIDRAGREVIPVIYDEVWCWMFMDAGFLGVKLNGKKGFVDFDGKEYFDF